MRTSRLWTLLLFCVLINLLLADTQLVSPLDRYRLPLTDSPTGSNLDRNAAIAITKIGQELGQQFNLGFLSQDRCGFFTRKWFEEIICSLSYYSMEKLTVEESRALANSLISEYRKKVLANPLLVRLISRDGNYPKDFELSEYITHCLAVKITFWTDEFEYIPAPYVGRIDVLFSQIKLYQLLPDSSFLQMLPVIPLECPR